MTSDPLACRIFGMQGRKPQHGSGLTAFHRDNDAAEKTYSSLLWSVKGSLHFKIGQLTPHLHLPLIFSKIRKEFLLRTALTWSTKCVFESLCSYRFSSTVQSTAGFLSKFGCLFRAGVPNTLITIYQWITKVVLVHRLVLAQKNNNNIKFSSICTVSLSWLTYRAASLTFLMVSSFLCIFGSFVPASAARIVSKLYVT